MMKSLKLLQLVALSAFFLFTLKMAGLLFGDGYMLSGTAPATAQFTEEKIEQAQEVQPGKAADGTMPAQTGDQGSEDEPKRTIKVGPGSSETPTEFAVLQSLAKRRKALEERERSLGLRENLLKAAEKRVEGRIAELKKIEQRITAALKRQEEIESERFTRLVKMYSSMKAQEAARIFDRLNMDVLIGLVQRMKARQMSKILALMRPAQAERLTIELAKQDKQNRQSIADPNTLPRVGGAGLEQLQN